MRHLIVAANVPERVLNAEELAADLASGSHGKAHIHVDRELAGATKAWAAAIGDYLLTNNVGPLEPLVVLPDDCELSHNYDPMRAFEAARDSGASFCDLQANHRGAKSAYESGFGFYTTPDGFTAFGSIAQGNTWRHFLSFVKQMEASPLKFDELVNVWSQLHNRPILKPTMSMVEHLLEFKSLEGNDAQPVEMRRSQHFDASASLPSDDVVPLGRTYASNHWRFLWTMGPELRQQTGYVEAAYRVHAQQPVGVVRRPPKDTSQASSTEKAT